MLYYIQICSNECHVVVPSVTPGWDIAMQGHSGGCQTSGTWVVEPGCCSQDIYIKPSCWSLGRESCRLLAPLGDPVPAMRGAEHLRKPERYPGLIHLVFHFQTLTEVFGGPRGWGQQWQGWVAALTKPCGATPCQLQGYRPAPRGKAELSPNASCKYIEVSGRFCQAVQWDLGCVSYRNDFGKVSLQSDTRTYK